MPRIERQAKEGQLVKILDGLVDGFFSLDGQGKITFMNRAARTMLASAGKDPTGKHFSAVLGAIPELAEKVSLATDGRTAVYFETFSAKLALWLEMIVFPAEDGLAATFRNINERKLSEERLRTIFTDNPHGMALLTWPEAAFVEVNGAWLRDTGFAREEVLGKTGAELGLWDEKTRDELRECLAENGCIRERDVPVRKKNGEMLIALLSAEFVELQGRKFLMTSSLDISERIRSEELTREQLGLLEDFSDADASVATLIVDEAGSIVRFFGERSMFAIDPEGENMRTVLPPPVAADLLAMAATVLAAGAARTVEFRAAAAGEQIKTVRVTAAPMTRRYRGKRTLSFRIQDITAEQAAADKSTLAQELYGQSVFFNSLLTGGHTAEYVAGELENFGVDTRAEYACFALQVMRDEPPPAAFHSGETVNAQAAGKSDIAAWLAKNGPGWAWQSGGHIAQLVPADKAGRTTASQVEYAGRLADEVEARFAFTRVYAGVAATAGATLDLQDLYGKAAEALLLCGPRNGRKVVHHADTGLYQVAFQLLKDRNMQRIVQDTIGSLAAYDRGRENNLVATLERIIEDENLRVVAEKMFIHHNTAIWRKKRIEKLLGLSLDSFETRAMVSLYLKIWQLSGQD